MGVAEKNIALVTRPDAGHTFLTVDTGNTCGVSASPFVGDCDYDQAGAILKWKLEAPGQHETGKYVVFDQSPFATGFGNGLSSEGVVYIPEACAKKDGCRLHIALHGCEQNREEVGKAFIEGSGFARWADANRFVILFPQVSANPLLNPKGCWVAVKELSTFLKPALNRVTGEDYLTKDAPQIAAIWRMVEHLAKRPVAMETK